MDIVDRLFELLAESKLNQQDFADKIGVKKNAISRWKKRELQSYTKYLSQIAEVLGTTPEYLLTGEGSRHKAKAVPESDTVSEEAHLVALAYDQADEKSRAMVRLALNLDTAEPTASPVSDKAM